MKHRRIGPQGLWRSLARTRVVIESRPVTKYHASHGQKRLLNRLLDQQGKSDQHPWRSPTTSNEASEWIAKLKVGTTRRGRSALNEAEAHKRAELQRKGLCKDQVMSGCGSVSVRYDMTLRPSRRIHKTSQVALRNERKAREAKATAREFDALLAGTS